MASKNMRMIFGLLLVLLPWPKYICSIDNDLVKTGTVSNPLESAPVISAVLIECSKLPRKSNQTQTAKYRYNERHIIATIRVRRTFDVENVENFFVLEKVFDMKKGSKARLMFPYLIQITRGEPNMMYPLEFSRLLNLNGENNTKLFHDKSIYNGSGMHTDCPKEAGTQLESVKHVFMDIDDAMSPAGISNPNLEPARRTIAPSNISLNKCPTRNRKYNENKNIITNKMNFSSQKLQKTTHFTQQKRLHKNVNENWQRFSSETRPPGWTENSASRNWKTTQNLMRCKGLKRLNKYVYPKYYNRQGDSTTENNNTIYQNKEETPKIVLHKTHHDDGRSWVLNFKKFWLNAVLRVFVICVDLILSLVFLHIIVIS